MAAAPCAAVTGNRHRRIKKPRLAAGASSLPGEKRQMSPSQLPEKGNASSRVAGLSYKTSSGAMRGISGTCADIETKRARGELATPLVRKGK